MRLMALVFILANGFPSSSLPGTRLDPVGRSLRTREQSLGFSVAVSISEAPRTHEVHIPIANLSEKFSATDPFHPRLTLPMGRRTFSRSIFVDPSENFVVGKSSLSIDIALTTGTSFATFGFRDIGADDVISIVQVQQGQFLASVAHSQDRIGCRAACGDGREGHPCVDCDVNGIKIRVCC